MNAEWHSAIVKGIPYLFHHCRQLANERKHHGKPPEMEYVLARGCLGGFFVKVVRLPAHMWCSRGVTCARYVEMGIGGEATVTKAEVDNWFREMLKVAQQTYCLKLQFRSLRAIPSDVLHLENLRELDVVGNTLVRAQTCRSVGPFLLCCECDWLVREALCGCTGGHSIDAAALPRSAAAGAT